MGLYRGRYSGATPAVVVAVLTVFVVLACVVGPAMPALFARTPPAVNAQAGRRIVVDHTSVALFPLIPAQYITAARNMRMIYMNKSVGDNISGGLDCVGPNTITNCAKPPNAITSTLYSRASWVYRWFAVSGCGAWYELVDCFKTSLDNDGDAWDVAMYGISYDAADDSDVLAYFADTASGREVGDYESYLGFRNLPVVLWTSSIKNAGPDITDQYNALMRTYASAHGLALFDLADIESHDLAGNACVSWSGHEPGLCKIYTDNPNDGNGHLNKTGQIQVAKALWVLMAQLAGWNPGEPEPEPSATATSILQSPLATPTPGCPCDPPCPCATATATPSRTPTSTAQETAQPSPTATASPPVPTLTVAPSPVPPTATPGTVQCGMDRDMAAYMSTLMQRDLGHPFHYWPVLLNGGEITRQRVTSQISACDARAQQ